MHTVEITNNVCYVNTHKLGKAVKNGPIGIVVWLSSPDDLTLRTEGLGYLMSSDFFKPNTFTDSCMHEYVMITVHYILPDTEWYNRATIMQARRQGGFKGFDRIP